MSYKTRIPSLNILTLLLRNTICRQSLSVCYAFYFCAMFYILFGPDKFGLISKYFCRFETQANSVHSTKEKAFLSRVVRTQLFRALVSANNADYMSYYYG